MGAAFFIIEDNLADIELLSEACREVGFAVDWTTASDGVAALDTLEKIPAGSEPQLILLDLNLPKLKGAEVLVRLKAMPRLEHVPVVILTSSSSPVDRNRCMMADAFLAKSATWNEFLDLARDLQQFAKTGVIARSQNSGT